MRANDKFEEDFYCPRGINVAIKEMFKWMNMLLLQKVVLNVCQKPNISDTINIQKRSRLFEEVTQFSELRI